MAGRTAPSNVREALTAYTNARSSALALARKELKIGEGDANALLLIADSPGIRPSELSTRLGITSAGVTAMIDRLVERNLVRRDADPLDRRVNRITLSIDLYADPWSSLTRFDTDFDDAVGLADQDDCLKLSELLGSLTTSTTGRLGR